MIPVIERTGNITYAGRLTIVDHGGMNSDCHPVLCMPITGTQQRP